MRKLILEVQLTVDGYVADPNGKTDWQVWNWDKNWSWDDELKKYFNDVMDSVDCILLSRKMAKEGFIENWKQAAADQKDPRYAYAKKINEMHKVVFSKTMKETEWDNIDLAKGDLAAEVNRLKALAGKSMIVYGGATFVSSLIKEGLIDEFQLFINPVAIGDGMSIFKETKSRNALSLVDARPYACGIVVLNYKLKT
jgi:dihydrofolate reductase